MPDAPEPETSRPAPAPAALLLLTGGQGRRLGGPKHLQAHPDGGTWGGHLVAVFKARFPGCPMQLLGQPLPDHPDLIPVTDPRQGPAVALAHWAASQPPPAERWWVAACDQVRWTPEALGHWHARALAADPGATRWVLAQQDGRTQFLGGWLPGALLGPLAGLSSRSLWGLAEALPTVLLASEAPEWVDVDTPEALSAWLNPSEPG